MLKIKLAACWIAYLLIIIALFSPGLINITQYAKGKPAGIAIFAILTGALLYFSLYITRKESLEKLKAIADNANIPIKKSIEDQLYDFYKYSQDSMFRLDGRIADEVHRMGELAESMRVKLKNIDQLLFNTFSITDLTYSTYKSKIESAMEGYIKNCRAVQTRADTFDPKWDKNNDTALVFEGEMQLKLQENEDMLNQVDKLLLELVRLGDIGDDNSKAEMLKLIDDTKNYASIKGGIK